MRANPRSRFCRRYQCDRSGRTSNAPSAGGVPGQSVIPPIARPSLSHGRPFRRTADGNEPIRQPSGAMRQRIGAVPPRRIARRPCYSILAFASESKRATSPDVGPLPAERLVVSFGTLRESRRSCRRCDVLANQELHSTRPPRPIAGSPFCIVPAARLRRLFRGGP